jgi:hypothetical protein
MWRPTLAAALASSVLAMSNPALPQGYGIQILESRYGIPGKAMDVTGIVGASCEGRRRCIFPVANGYFGSDPAFGAAKEVVVYWTCGGGRNRSAFPENSTATLSC